MNFDEFGHVAEVRNDGHLHASSAESESHRIGGIVRDGKCVNIDISNGEMLTCVNGFHAAKPFFQAVWKRALECIECLFGDVERSFPDSEHLRQAIAMIGMFVADEDSIELFERDMAGREARQSFAFAKTAIH